VFDSKAVHWRRRVVIQALLVGGFVFLAAAGAVAAPSGQRSKSVDSDVLSASQLSSFGIDPSGCTSVTPVSKSALLAALPDLATDPDIAAASWVPPACAGSDKSVNQVEPTPASSNAGSVTSTNWAGYVAPQYQGSTNWRSVQSNWVVPQLSESGAPDWNGAFRSADWVGIGSGDSNSQMLGQDGTEQEAIVSQCTGQGCNFVSYYAFWWELWPMNSQQFLSSPAVNPGDSVKTYFEHSGSGQGYFVFDNISNNTMTSFYKTWGSNYTLDTTQMEWIFERPESGGNLYALPSQSDSDFASAQGVATSGNIVGLGGANAAKWEMRADCGVNSEIIASTSAISAPNSFNTSWVHEGWQTPVQYPCP
jgi:hypothetical protein